MGEVQAVRVAILGEDVHDVTLLLDVQAALTLVVAVVGAHAA